MLKRLSVILYIILLLKIDILIFKNENLILKDHYVQSFNQKLITC